MFTFPSFTEGIPDEADAAMNNHADTAKENSTKSIPITTFIYKLFNKYSTIMSEAPVVEKRSWTLAPKLVAMSMGWIAIANSISEVARAIRKISVEFFF